MMKMVRRWQLSPKTARRFLNRSTWKMAGGKIFPPSFYRRINQAKVVLGADPLKIDDNRLVDRVFADKLARMFRF